MAEDNALVSVLLSTVTSLVKKIDAMESSQKESNELIKQLKTESTDAKEQLRQLSNLPTSWNNFIQKYTEQNIEQLEALNTELQGYKQEVLAAVAETNSAKNMETIQSLIEGLRQMNQNIDEVANRMETLSNHVVTSYNATNDLTSTIFETNARVQSMDTRMGTILANDDDLPNDPAEALALLQQYAQKTSEKVATFDDYAKTLQATSPEVVTDALTIPATKTISEPTISPAPLAVSESSESSIDNEPIDEQAEPEVDSVTESIDVDSEPTEDEAKEDMKPQGIPQALQNPEIARLMEQFPELAQSKEIQDLIQNFDRLTKHDNS